MTAFSILLYGLLNLAFLTLFVGVKSSGSPSQSTPSIQHGFLISFTLQGLTSLLFGLLQTPLGLNTINLILLMAVGVMSLWWQRHDRHPALFIANFSVGGSLAVSSLLSFFIAGVAGLLFYTPDLIPSALSGDPGRHFIGLLDPSEMNLAQIHKPVYYLMGGIFVHSFPFLEKDQLFVLFNIFVLGLSTSSTLILFRNLYPTAKFLAHLTTTVLVGFGYSFFILQYGGYTLVLSSAFLFSLMALLVECRDRLDKRAYGGVTLLALGVVLTHSYLAPDTLLILICFSWWNARRLQIKISSELWQRLPFWMLIVMITIASNHGLMGVEAFARVIVVQAYVNESFYIDVLPFLPLAAAYLFLDRKSESAQLIFVFFIAAVSFSFYMLALHKYGASTYYLNRNQIVLLPLLVMACVAMIQRIDETKPELSKIIYILSILSIALPYFVVKNLPLAVSEKKLKELLDVNQLVYAQNVINTSLSPLQMTQKDRHLMREIGAGKSQCIDGTKDQVAALDTDLEVIWFEIYTKITPFFIQRNNKILMDKGFFNNYKEWISDPTHNHIVVFRNFVLWGFPETLVDIKLNFSLVCRGDSIDIYRRPIRSSAAPTIGLHAASH